MSTRRPRAAAGQGHARHDAAERGVVLIWATVCVLLMASVILTGLQDLGAMAALTDAQFGAESQAVEIAHGGLDAAISWFRRQTKQPVARFAPGNGKGKDKSLSDTEDASVGLVRSYEISPGLWARFVVRAGVPAELFDDVNLNGHFDPGEPFQDMNGDNNWTPALYARDVSQERGRGGRGGVWYLISEGFVYVRPRSDLALGDGDNRLVASARIATEITRLTLNLPASAAVSVKWAVDINLGTRTRLTAPNSTALAHAGGRVPEAWSQAEVRGPTSRLSNFKADVQTVFGMGWDSLRSIADVSARDVPGALPDRVADYTMHVVSGDVVYDAQHPLVGTGIVVVQGDCTIAEGSHSAFYGLLYVSGKLTARAPAKIVGQTVALGGLDAHGSGGDFVEFEYDRKLIDLLRVRMGQYRASKGRFVPLPTLPDGRPSERDRSARRLGGYEGVDAFGSVNAEGPPLLAN